MPSFVPYDYTSAIGCPSVDEQPCPSVVPENGGAAVISDVNHINLFSHIGAVKCKN